MILNLNLKKKWYDLIAKGEKLEEYREIKEYWLDRLLCWPSQKPITDTWNKDIYTDCLIRWVEKRTIKKGDEMIGFDFKPFTHVRFQNGWARGGKPAPSMTLAIREIRISEGVPQWGAEPGIRYFVIKLGERIL